MKIKWSKPSIKSTLTVSMTLGTMISMGADLMQSNASM